MKNTPRKIDLFRDRDGRHVSTGKVSILEASALNQAHTFTAFVVAEDHSSEVVFGKQPMGLFVRSCLSMRGLLGFFGVSGGTEARGSKWAGQNLAFYGRYP